MTTADKMLLDSAQRLGIDLLKDMNAVIVKKIDVHHIIEGVHTDECENVDGWDTVWNTNLANEQSSNGMWQCPYCKCVSWKREYIPYEQFKEENL